MNILNIVNGMAMYQRYKDDEIQLEGDVVPFNEAMCQGVSHENIFSQEFILERSVSLNVTEHEYEDIVIQPLIPLFSLDYDAINLYFDQDMFCQINLLTMLAYLDRNEFEGKLTAYIIDSEYNVIKGAVVTPTGFYNVYIDVVINHRFPETILPETLLDGIIMYLSYIKGETVIHDFIRQNIHADQEELLAYIFENFSEYGLGDVQIIKLIEDIGEEERV